MTGIQFRNAACFEVYCDVLEGVVGEADLDGLVDVEHIDFVVPGVGVQGCAVAVVVHEAGAVLDEEADHRGGTWTAVHPD